MTESVMGLERVSMVQGPYDSPHMYEICEGVLYDHQYFFYLENGILCLRHVKKVEQSYHTHLYLDGESGGGCTRGSYASCHGDHRTLTRQGWTDIFIR